MGQDGWGPQFRVNFGWVRVGSLKLWVGSRKLDVDCKYQPVAPRSAFARSSRLPLGDNPTAAMTSPGEQKSVGIGLNDELCACCCRLVNIVYGSAPPCTSSFLLSPEVVAAPEVDCFLTLKHREGCRSSFGDAGPDGPRSERQDLFEVDDPCLSHKHAVPRQGFIQDVISGR